MEEEEAAQRRCILFLVCFLALFCRPLIFLVLLNLNNNVVISFFFFLSHDEYFYFNDLSVNELTLDEFFNFGSELLMLVLVYKVAN